MSTRKVAIEKKPSFTKVSSFQFDEIYSIAFTLEPIVLHTKDIWLV
jgi:hypothetical protein